MDAQDHVDRFLESISGDLPIDLEVEGIVDRLNGLSRRIRRMNDETLAEHGLSHVEWRALGYLRHAPDRRVSVGTLAARTELSSGAMTSRLDSLEAAGFVRRVADPHDRRGVLVELTEKGDAAYVAAVTAQAAKEGVVAAALTQAEKHRLNALLRKLMLEFERQEAARSTKAR